MTFDHRKPDNLDNQRNLPLVHLEHASQSYSHSDSKLVNF